MVTPKFHSFVKQHGHLWCKGKGFTIYTAPRNMAHNDTDGTLYVENDANVSLEQVKEAVIADHIEMYNNSTIDRAEGITLDDIIDGLNRLNFIAI